MKLNYLVRLITVFGIFAALLASRSQDVSSDPKLTQTQKNIALKKSNLPVSAQFNNIWLGVSRARQTNSYYCGPATIYQQVRFLKGWSNAQQFYAGAPTYATSFSMDKLDTNKYGATPWDNMHRTLNYHVNNFYYARSFVTSKTDFKNKINSTLSQNAPVALLLRTDTQYPGVFSYSSRGHFFSIAGQNTGATLYLIVDPNSASKYYYISDAEAYKAVVDKAKIIYY